jgi:peptide/nickel transport system substrate-binding protein
MLLLISLASFLVVLLSLDSCSDKEAMPGEGTAQVEKKTESYDKVMNPDRDRFLSPEERARRLEFGGIIQIRFPNNPGTLNNLTRGDVLAKSVLVFLYPKLLFTDYDTCELTPFAAASLPEVSEDKKVYTWRIRKGLKWDDFEKSGAYVTSRDVKFSFDLMKDPATGAQTVAADFNHLVDIQVVDDWTFEAVYDDPTADAVYKMGEEFRIMPSHILEDVPHSEIAKHPIGREPVGYGPFRFVQWKDNREILLRRNDLNREIFPKAFRPHVDGLRFLTITDQDMVLPLFLRGELDLALVSADDWQFKTQDPAFEEIGSRHCYFLPHWYYIAWNNESPLFNDARVRHAMTHMVRREEILETHLHGLGKVISGPLFYFSRGYDRSITPLSFDPKTATRLLKEAGWEDHDGDGILDKEIDGKQRKFEFEFLKTVSKNVYLEAIASTMKEDLRKIGIKMTVRELEFSALRKQYGDHHFDAVALGSSTSPIYEDPYGAWHSSQTAPGKFNRASYINLKVDALLEQVRLEHDMHRRYDLLNQFHGIIHEDQPFTFLYSMALSIVINRRWRNVKIHKLGVLFYEWWLPPENRKPSDVLPE